MASRRRICVVTGSRAEYGLLYWLIKEIASDPDLELQLLVTGMHLAPKFGLTFRQIEADGFLINSKVEMLVSSDTPSGITKSIGLGVIGFADAFQRLEPDIIVVLGDRFEILSAAQAAMVARIPIAHIHGGETTVGAFDEGIRHAITKMAQWHFVSAEPYRKRVIQLGESPDRVFNFGAPGLDHLAKVQLISKPELEAALGFRLGSPLFVVTYHPATLQEERPAAAMQELLAALEKFPRATVILTYPNADTWSSELIACIDAWVARHGNRAKAFTSLGQQLYLNLLRVTDVVIGNSSSGLIEAPALKKATVNLGARQTGRLKATSVIDAAEHRADIEVAIGKALSSEFCDHLSGTVSLYGSGNTSARIKDMLKVVQPLMQKVFFDIDHGN